MISEKTLVELLKDFKALLKDEKKALIENKVDRIQEIIKEKEAYAESFDQMEIQESERETAIQLIQDIRELQETNLMLTEQALNYAGTFIDAFQKEAKKSSVTYSKKGQYQQTAGTNLLDQSL